MNRTARMKLIILLVLVPLLLTSCFFAFPRGKVNQFIGIFGFSDDHATGFAVNLLVIGVSARIGSRLAFGIYGTRAVLATDHLRFLPHIHVELLPFLHGNVGLSVLIVSLGI